MNTIVYNNKTYGKEIIRINPFQSNSMIADTLASDVMEVELNIATPSEIIPFQYGSVISYYHDSDLVGKFRLSKVDRVSKTIYRMTCVSYVGIMEHIMHYGGVYSGTTLGAIMRDIFATAGMVEGTDYEIEQKVSNIPASGYLPPASCRDNLKQCLFSCGASLVKDDTGKILIFFNAPTTYEEIPKRIIYEGGSLEYPPLATKVTVVEHSYAQTALDKEVQLYDSEGTNVTEKLVVFDKPCYHIEWTGSELVYPTSLTQGTNYAIVTGNGVLTGKEYSHSTNEVSVDTGIDGDPYELKVTDMTLVSLLNSKNCAERVASYHANAQIIGTSFVLDHERPMDRVLITDPYDIEKIGYIAELDIEASNTVKANAKIVTNWSPNHIGNEFNNYKIFKRSDITSGKITIPQEAVGQKGRFILFGGFCGGNGGYDGEGGIGTSGVEYWIGTSIIGRAHAGAGGEGGQAGEGGIGFKTLQVDVDALASNYNATIGVGGSGGSRNGGEGSIGGDTSIVVGGTTKTTATQDVQTSGIANALTGDVYGDMGYNGIAGAKGGDGAEGRFEGYDGESVTYNGTVFRGGIGGDGEYYTSGSTAHAYGGGGAGASYGTNGANGGDGRVSGIFQSYGGQGANGANAQPLPTAEFGKCGNGGNGGGGGGGGGQCFSGSTSYQRGVAYPASDSSGGLGSVGGQGSDGFILLYYN